MIVEMQLPSSVVFDFDGIVLERCGQSLAREEWCDQIGLWEDGQAERWFGRLRGRPGAPGTFEEFQAEKRRLFQELVSRDPMRGITDLLDLLTAHDVPAGVASSSPARWVVPALERIKLRGRFGAVVTAEDVSRRKPAPDVYLEATRRLAANPVRSIAIEDSGPGVAAARAAGMKTIAIPHWLTERHDLSSADLLVAHAGEVTLERLAALIADGTV
jgi:HAD superfamily hydrolase (TIGR01509 family)